MNKVFYSIISFNSHPATGEKIAIGLLMFDSENLNFSFSKKKILLANQLKPEMAFAMDKAIESWTNLFSIWQKKIKTLDLLAEAEHIHRSENGFITISLPHLIKMDLSEESFRNRFEDWISGEQENKVFYESTLLEPGLIHEEEAKYDSPSQEEKKS